MPDSDLNGGPSLELSSEQEIIRQAARDFAQKEIAPIAAELDESGEPPGDTLRKMGTSPKNGTLCRSASDLPPPCPNISTRSPLGAVK